jgi:hypothetical protein
MVVCLCETHWHDLSLHLLVELIHFPSSDANRIDIGLNKLLHNLLAVVKSSIDTLVKMWQRCELCEYANIRCIPFITIACRPLFSSIALVREKRRDQLLVVKRR